MFKRRCKDQREKRQRESDGRLRVMMMAQDILTLIEHEATPGQDTKALDVNAIIGEIRADEMRQQKREKRTVSAARAHDISSHWVAGTMEWETNPEDDESSEPIDPPEGMLCMHRVLRGDSFATIADKFMITEAQLKKANGFDPSSKGEEYPVKGVYVYVPVQLAKGAKPDIVTSRAFCEWKKKEGKSQASQRISALHHTLKQAEMEADAHVKL